MCTGGTWDVIYPISFLQNVTSPLGPRLVGTAMSSKSFQDAKRKHVDITLGEHNALDGGNHGRKHSSFGPCQPKFLSRRHPLCWHNWGD